ncbi:hypothetical protein BHE74_00050287, partial [Ensete ventricosum]
MEVREIQLDVHVVTRITIAKLMPFWVGDELFFFCFPSCHESSAFHHEGQRSREMLEALVSSGGPPDVDQLVPPSARDQVLDVHAHVDPVDGTVVEFVPRGEDLLLDIPRTHGVVEGAGEECLALMGREANAANIAVVADEVEHGHPGPPDVPHVDGTAGGGGYEELVLLIPVAGDDSERVVVKDAGDRPVVADV